MSRVLWSNVLLPPAELPAQPFRSELYGDKILLERTKALPIAERQAELPDRRVYRSLSRCGVLLSLVGLAARDALVPFLEADPFSVGIYCAVENGPVDFASAREMAQGKASDFAPLYKKLINPKMYLRQLPSLAPAQTGIFLGILGPLQVYNDSRQGGLLALSQAEIDLTEGRVAAALVCSAFSFENPLIMERIARRELKGRILCEGAGALLLTADGTEHGWKDIDSTESHAYYAISHQIIMHIQKRRVPDGR